MERDLTLSRGAPTFDLSFLIGRLRQRLNQKSRGNRFITMPSWKQLPVTFERPQDSLDRRTAMR